MKYTTKSLSTLTEFFFVWMGEKTDETPKLRAFLQKTHLDMIISPNDLSAILKPKYVLRLKPDRRL